MYFKRYMHEILKEWIQILYLKKSSVKCFDPIASSSGARIPTVQPGLVAQRGADVVNSTSPASTTL